MYVFLLFYDGLFRFFPELNLDVDHEHDALHEAMHRLRQLVNDFQVINKFFLWCVRFLEYNAPHLCLLLFSLFCKQAAPAPAKDAAAVSLLTGVHAIFHIFVISTLAHLRHEEETITVVVRKYVPLEYQRELVGRVFDLQLKVTRVFP